MMFYSLFIPYLCLFYTPPFLQVSKSIVMGLCKSILNMIFYSLFIPCLFCVNIFVSHSFIITSFETNDSFKSSIFLFCFFLAKNQDSVSPSWICHKNKFLRFSTSAFLINIKQAPIFDELPKYIMQYLVTSWNNK